MISTVLFALSLLLVEGRDIPYEAMETPSFRWASPTLSRSSDDVPDLHVEFMDGSKDIIELTRYTPIVMTDIDSCTFMGSLKGERDTVVAVTGCPQSSEYQVSILRKYNPDVTVNVEQSGKSTPIDFPQEYGFDHVIPPIDDIQNYTSTRSDIGVANRELPPENYLRLVIGYTESAVSYFGDVNGFKEWFAKFMTLMQAFYMHPSLTVEIKFDTPVPMVDMRSRTVANSATGENLDGLRGSTPEILEQNGNGQHFMLFVHDNSGDRTVGIAYLSGVCRSVSLSVSISEVGSPAFSAKVATHELGHNLGLGHVQDPCDGIMYFSTGGGNTWSTCSVTALKAYYESVVQETGSWCLERADPTEAGGSWTPWQAYSACSKPCGGGTQSRSRVCVGNDCPGESTEEASCNTEECKACTNTGSQCDLRAQYGWCGGEPQYMKTHCPQSCNRDRIGSSTCAQYEELGFCAEDHVNFQFMMGNCGLTCGYFC